MPKSVKLLKSGVVLPAFMVFELPLTNKVEVGCAVVVKPFAKGPGDTQLDTEPVNAKDPSVPVFPPAASVKVVTAVLEPEGIPWLK